MDKNTIGIILTYYREKYNLTQEQVCEGICSLSTFSRIEQGTREVDSLVVEALIERIGKEINLFEIIVNENDYLLWEKRKEIENALTNKKYDLVKNALKLYENNMPHIHLYKQLCIYYNILLKIIEKDKKEEIIENAKCALNITKINFNESFDKKKLYRPIEIELILIVLKYSDMENKEKEESELLNLYNYINKYYTERKKEIIGEKILLVMIEKMIYYKEYEKAIYYADLSISLIGQGRGFYNLGKIYFLKAIAMNYKGLVCNSECKIAYIMSYTVENVDLQKEIIKFCEEELKWHITEQEKLLNLIELH